MKFLDLNTFYGPKAGGIRTYHQAKIDWFGKRSEHEYLLVFPGSTHSSQAVFANVRLVTLPGPALTSDPEGYRLLWNPFEIARLFAQEKPDVVESGDPWMTGPVTLALHRMGAFKGLLSHFYHSDPIPSYFEPWSRKGHFPIGKSWLAYLAGNAFYRLQKLYPLTVTSSLVMQKSLQRQGIERVAFKPFGVPSRFLEAGSKRLQANASAMPKEGRRMRILYAGRLDSEKGWDILLPMISELCQDERFEITIAGRGRYAETLAALNQKQPHLHFLGFVAGQEAMETLYREADVLLAPGPYETFGLSVLEAMAAGLPVIGPNQGGSGELLQEAQSPLCFQAHDGKALWKTLGLAHEMFLKHELGIIAKQQNKVAMAYGTWDDAMTRLVKLYQNLHGVGRMA